MGCTVTKSAFLSKSSVLSNNPIGLAFFVYLGASYLGMNLFHCSCGCFLGWHIHFITIVHRYFPVLAGGSQGINYIYTGCIISGISIGGISPLAPLFWGFHGLSDLFHPTTKICLRDPTSPPAHPPLPIVDGWPQDNISRASNSYASDLQP